MEALNRLERYMEEELVTETRDGASYVRHLEGQVNRLHNDLERARVRAQELQEELDALRVADDDPELRDAIQAHLDYDEGEDEDTEPTPENDDAELMREGYETYDSTGDDYNEDDEPRPTPPRYKAGRSETTAAYLPFEDTDDTFIPDAVILSKEELGLFLQHVVDISNRVHKELPDDVKVPVSLGISRDSEPHRFVITWQIAR